MRFIRKGQSAGHIKMGHANTPAVLGGGEPEFSTSMYSALELAGATVDFAKSGGGTITVAPSLAASTTVAKLDDNGLAEWVALVETTSIDRCRNRSVWVNPNDNSIVWAIRNQSSNRTSSIISIYNADGSLAATQAVAQPAGSNVNPTFYGLYVCYDEDGNYRWHSYGLNNAGSNKRAWSDAYPIQYDKESGLIGLGNGGGQSGIWANFWVDDRYTDGLGTLTVFTRTTSRTHLYYAWTDPLTGEAVDFTHWGGGSGLNVLSLNSGSMVASRQQVVYNEQNGNQTNAAYAYTPTFQGSVFSQGAYAVQPRFGGSGFNQGTVAILNYDQNYEEVRTTVFWTDVGVSPFYGELAGATVATGKDYTVVASEERNRANFVYASENRANNSLLYQDQSWTFPPIPSGDRRHYHFCVANATNTAAWARATDTPDHFNPITWVDEDAGLYLFAASTVGTAIINTGESDQASLINNFPSADQGYLVALDIATGDIVWTAQVQPLGNASLIQSECGFPVVRGGAIFASFLIRGDGHDFGGQNVVPPNDSALVIAKYDLATGAFISLVEQVPDLSSAPTGPLLSSEYVHDWL